MLRTDNTEAQIIADMIKEGGSLPQAFNVVSTYCRQQNHDEVAESCIAGVVSHLEPKRTSLLKENEGPEDPESEWTKARLNFCSQFLVRRGLAMCNSPKLCLQPRNVAPICTHTITWFDETHEQQVVSGNGCSKTQVRFRYDENGTLDTKGAHDHPKYLLHVKCTKEARFCAGVAIVMKDGAEVGARLPLLSHNDKRVTTIKEWNEAVAKEMRRVKSLTGNESYWVVNTLPEGAARANDAVPMLRGTGPTTDKNSKKNQHTLLLI